MFLLILQCRQNDKFLVSTVKNGRVEVLHSYTVTQYSRTAVPTDTFEINVCRRESG